MIENPQPSWLPFLLLALPGIGFAAYAVNKFLFPNDDRPLCTVGAIGLVLALLPTHLLALATGSLNVGLAAAWSGIGAGGYAWLGHHWQKFPPRIRGRARLGCRLGIAALATLPIVLPTILLNFHDETYFGGHQAIIAHLQNGSYPPRYLYEPSLPLRYHYGFDLAAAIVTGLLRIRIDQAIDILTLALWPTMFLLLWRVGEHVGGRRAGLLVALAVSFSTGLCPTCTVNGLKTNPPFVSYFFQHPWGLGIVIFCLLVLQRAALDRTDNQVWRVGALVCSLLLLSLAQAVLFVVTVIAFGFADFWKFVRSGSRTAVTVLFGLAAAVLGTKLMGGFFDSASYPSAGGVLGTGFYLREYPGNNAVLEQIEWNLLSFGLPLVLGVLGLCRAHRERVLLAALAGTSLIAVNGLRYGYSWDITKFAAVTSIALAIGTGIFLAGLLDWALTSVRRLIFGALAIAVAGLGVVYPFYFLLAISPKHRPAFSMQMIRPYISKQYPVDVDSARAVNFLRTHMQPAEVLYVGVKNSEPYAIWGGLPTQSSVYPADTADDDVYGLGKGKFAARMDLSRISGDWFDRLSAEHVSWLVTEPDDVAVITALHNEEGGHRAALVAEYGTVSVFYIAPVKGDNLSQIDLKLVPR